eukprot:NODE_3024_length_1044_cov_156.739368_g2882_i0.p1 GENE.NODE_3024_length_1044_cov_156.739368_g2882_i0~~NODE_3024_length_1044_cov_156.739368_g2882_i0.p1  ORF type:complete len:275 (-),score=82.83 NODE_3024_length_1044_cov_156.739368_g2882_i0:162-986(-)
MSTAKIRIDPIVVFQIIDHYMRRGKDQVNVIGALLGSKAPDGRWDVRDSIPVPHTEASEVLSIDVEFQRVMKELCQKVETQNFIVGWYSTAFTDNSPLLYEFYAKNLPDPIHLLVDPTLKGGSMNVKTLVSQTLHLGDRSIGPMFREVAFDWNANNAEKLAIAMMQRTPTAAEEDEDDVPEMQQMQLTMRRLHTNLTKAHDYVTRILNGEEKEDKTIGRELIAAISSIPSSSPAAFDKVFNESLQDMLMVIYLSKLTKAQVLLTEKLHNVYNPV